MACAIASRNIRLRSLDVSLHFATLATRLQLHTMHPALTSPPVNPLLIFYERWIFATCSTRHCLQAFMATLTPHTLSVPSPTNHRNSSTPLESAWTKLSNCVNLGRYLEIWVKQCAYPLCLTFGPVEGLPLGPSQWMRNET